MNRMEERCEAVSSANSANRHGPRYAGLILQSYDTEDHALCYLRRRRWTGSIGYHNRPNPRNWPERSADPDPFCWRQSTRYPAKGREISSAGGGVTDSWFGGLGASCCSWRRRDFLEN